MANFAALSEDNLKDIISLLVSGAEVRILFVEFPELFIEIKKSAYIFFSLTSDIKTSAQTK